MEEKQNKKSDWKSYRFPMNITVSGRVTRLFIGTGLFTFGFWKRRPVFLFFGITELLSSATAYSPVYDAYGMYCKQKGIPNRLKPVEKITNIEEVEQELKQD